MLRFKIQNIYSKSPKIFLINSNSNIIGNSSYSIINSTEASINNIYIKFGCYEDQSHKATVSSKHIR